MPRYRRHGPYLSPLDKIKAQSVRQENGCLYFTGPVNERGYGRITVGGEDKKTHRVVLEVKLGRPIKEGYCALHTCDHPPCIEPEHLYEGTRRENNQNRQERLTRIKQERQEKPNA